MLIFLNDINYNLKSKRRWIFDQRISIQKPTQSYEKEKIYYKTKLHFNITSIPILENSEK